jgi:Domain of unknown function (DUF4159)/Aerotolerance regulator N-terminal
MLELGWFGLTNPWLLTALISLPALWWLLRIIPPAPKYVRFPAIRFLLGLEPEERTSARTPPWLLLLRLLLAALLIIALAGPVFNPDAELTGDGPLVIVVDDGWAAAPGWDARLGTIERLTARAQRDNREVILVGTVPDPSTPKVRLFSATDAMRNASTWEPKPWPVDRLAALEELRQESLDGAEIIWLSDGVATSPADRDDARRFAEELALLGPLQVFAEPVDQRALLLLPPEIDGERLTVTARRGGSDPAQRVAVKALGPGGEVLARETLVFETQADAAEAQFELPLEMSNRIARFEVEPRAAVGGVVLLDERWRRRVVGLVGEPAARASQPLLSELYYIERALAPRAEIHEGSVAELTTGDVSAIILPDGAQASGDAHARLAAWVEDGGVLLRFAGPRLANAEDDLVPVELRRGDRNLDGAMSWARPLPLTRFEENGPLADLRVPEGDVVVHRQVLAQPGPALAKRTWARLADGTPLITGAPRGDGWVVLVHTTANTTWSTLPLSGLFVALLQKVVALAPGAGGGARGLLAPIEVLDANGRLQEPSPMVQPIAAADLTITPASAEHPPGLYGRPEAGEEAARQALNLASAVPDLEAIQASDLPVPTRDYTESAEIDLMPWLLLAALVLALADTLIGLQLRGLLIRRRVAAGAAAALAGWLVLCGSPPPIWAQDEAIIAATAETRLAYVLTGLSDVDELSRAGLEGLSQVLNRRTAVEAGEPRGVNLAVDDLNLFPLLYWPIRAEHPDLAAGVVERIDAYLRQGGMILFDTADAASLIPGQPGPGPGEQRLRQLLGGLSLPPLEPVPEDHTLTRSFYLLQDFPGRWTGRSVWVDQADPNVNDGVSSVIIGGHDWAGAWAVDDLGLSAYPVLPGGERQRELARRVGVNVVMYALTGNYKTDQVHIPALLERLGQ